MVWLIEFESCVSPSVDRSSSDQRKEFHTLEDLGLGITDQCCYRWRQHFGVAVKREVMELVWCIYTDS